MAGDLDEVKKCTEETSNVLRNAFKGTSETSPGNFLCAPRPCKTASALRLTHFLHNACSENVPMTLHGSEQPIKRRVATPPVLPKE